MSDTYVKAPWSFKLKKGLRYVGLYGPSRTLTKVKAQYRLPPQGGPLSETRRPSSDSGTSRGFASIIGCGNFAYTTIAYYGKRFRRDFLLSAFDPNGERSVELCKGFTGAFAVKDPEEIVNDPRVKLVFIASNHATHADYAVRCIEAGKSVHIEKPHVVSRGQLSALVAAMQRNPNSMVFLGFNRPKSVHFRTLMDFLAGEQGPSMINWFIAGHEIPEGHWYFSDREGGRVLGNLCHWTDLTLRMVGEENAFPCEVIPAGLPGSKSDFVVSINFADGSTAALTFSAKGHTFEGVRENLNVHRGNVLAQMRDFAWTRIDKGSDVKVVRTLFREHGHGENILNSLGAVGGGEGTPESISYVRRTAELFLAVREALDTRVVVRVE